MGRICYRYDFEMMVIVHLPAYFLLLCEKNDLRTKINDF
jgi:hypothetical protein